MTHVRLKISKEMNNMSTYTWITYPSFKQTMNRIIVEKT